MGRWQYVCQELPVAPQTAGPPHVALAVNVHQPSQPSGPAVLRALAILLDVD